MAAEEGEAALGSLRRVEYPGRVPDQPHRAGIVAGADEQVELVAVREPVPFCKRLRQRDAQAWQGIPP
jgi:hypothetical protein